MAFNYSPKVVTDGLVLYLDAANPNSYVSGSTTWRDISRSGNNGTLVNGPTFNRSSGGVLNFDGTDECVLTNTSVITSVTDFTIDIIILYNSSNPVISSVFGYGIPPDSNSNLGFMLHAMEGGFYLLISDGTNRPSGVSISGLVNNSINHLTFVVKSNGVTKAYKNGTFLSTSTPSSFTTINVNSSFIVAMGRDVRYNTGTSLRHFLGGIFSTKLYNRELTTSEVRQNYNATKTRFGLT
jgi:hypothetical protein